MTAAAVFDCMVFVQALANAKGPARACYELVRNDRLVLHLSPRDRGRGGRRDEPSEGQAEASRLDGRAVVFSNVSDAFRLERDPKDECNINLALASKASYLETRDR